MGVCAAIGASTKGCEEFSFDINDLRDHKEVAHKKCLPFKSIRCLTYLIRVA